jgi:uncharacterized SAM-dependent methyltransferase
LLRAYDDIEGVTAEFDRNVLAHINRTHQATFVPDAFMHRALWNPTHSRIEMHLVSRRRHTVVVAGERVSFERGEAIVTEHCYKHSPKMIRNLCAAAGWRVQDVFPDRASRMSVWIATTDADGPGGA